MTSEIRPAGAAWIPCPRCGRQRREDSFCRCATDADIETFHRLMSGQQEPRENFSDE